MSQYKRINKQERYSIEQGINERLTDEEIELRIGRPAKTIRAEIRRNGGRVWYDTEQAEGRKRSNRKGFIKIERNSVLKCYILEKLEVGWSPVIIAGRWNNDNPKNRVSAETIYRWIYEHNKTLYKKLPLHKKQRGMKAARYQSKSNDHMPVTQRPKVVDDRERIGDFEMDTIYQKGNKSGNIVTVVERKSRYMEMRKNDSKHASVINAALQDIREKLPCKIKSATIDNGTEFSTCQALGVPIYACAPGAPWQKGSIENINRYVRRRLDYRIPIEDVSQDMLDKITTKINNTPRKILGFYSPIEYLTQQGISL